MRSKVVAAFILLLISNMGFAWAGGYSFSGYAKKLFGGDDGSRMCTVSFSEDGSSPAGDVVATFQFMNTGNAPVKGDPFFSQKVEIISKDEKTYEVPWDTGVVELADGSKYEIPGQVTPEKVDEAVKNHPELRAPSSFEELTAPPEKSLADASPKRSMQLINPGGTVKKVLYCKDPLIREVITSKNVDRVIFYSGMGKFILREKP